MTQTPEEKLAELIADSWFAFEGDVRVKPLDPPVVPELARANEDPAECLACARPDSDYLWTDEHWRLKGYLPTTIPGTVLLESRAHHDSYSDLPDRLLSDLGHVTKRIEDAILSSGEYGRVHTVRWGDGSAHFHVWFMPRPLGAMQLRGSMLPVWMDVLPDVEDDVAHAALARIAEHLHLPLDSTS